MAITTALRPPAPPRRTGRGDGARPIASRPRLCVVLPHLRLGGGETATLSVAEGLATRFRITVCALGYGTLDDHSDGNAVVDDVIELRDELAARFDDVVPIRRRYRLRPVLARADAVLWYGLTNAVPRALARLAPRPLSIRVVHTSRAADGERFARRWRHAIDATVCVVPAMARRIPGARFLPNVCGGAHLRGPRRVFFPEGRPTLGFLGRLLPQKNVAWLVEHLAELGCDLLVQGPDSELLTRAGLERRAARLGVAERLRFLPPKRDVGTLLRSVDALAVVSRHEGFPRVVIEAGLVGTPVIATAVGALPELFPDAVLWVERDAEGLPDVGALRAALRRAGPPWGARLEARVAELCDRRTVLDAWAELIDDARATRAAAV